MQMGNQKKAGVAILISDKIDFKIKTTRDKEGAGGTLGGRRRDTEKAMGMFGACIWGHEGWSKVQPD